MANGMEMFWILGDNYYWEGGFTSFGFEGLVPSF